MGTTQKLNNRLRRVFNLTMVFIFTLGLLLSVDLIANSKPPASPKSKPKPAKPAIEKCITSVAKTHPPGLSSSLILERGDTCYTQGDKTSAVKWYSLAKPAFKKTSSIPEPIYESDRLSPGGKVFWREYERYKDTDLVSAQLIPLLNLVNKDPNFVPGYLSLVNLYRKHPGGCEKYAGSKLCADQPQTPAEVLESVAAQFPADPELAKMRVELLVDEDNYLEASIAARQFALFQTGHPEAEKFGQLADQYLKRYRSKFRQEMIIKGIFGCTTGILTNQVNGCALGMMLIEGESNFGQKVAEGFKQKLTLVDDPVVVEYVKGIADKMLPFSGRTDFNYEFYVVSDNAMNAFALPGGKIFINTGAILHSKSEAELAGLIGHEIAHAVFSHGYQRIANQTLAMGLSQIIPFGDLIFTLTGASFSRSNEKEADILGTRLITTTGYAADGLRNLMETMVKLESKNLSSSNIFANWLRTHPASSDRVKYLEELIVKNGYDRYAFEGVKQHRAIQQRLTGKN